MKKLSLLLCMTALSAGSALAQFTVGNLAVFVADSSVSNTTASIVELNKTSASQTAVNTYTINGATGTNALRFSGSASSTGYMSNSDDGSLLLFTGGNTTSTSGNINTVLTRGVGSYNNAGTFSLATTYTGASGKQTRCATTTDNTNYYIADQGGLFTNNATTASPTGNYRGVKSFGGVVYIAMSSSTSTTIAVNTVSAASGGTVTGLTGLTNDANLQDFYLIQSGTNGSTYDVLYMIDATSNTAGTILKYSLVSGTWTSNGSYTTSFGGFGLAAEPTTTGANLYVSSGQGALTANSVMKLEDLAGYNTAINITTANNITLYTAATGAIVKGVAFAPGLPPSATVTATPDSILTPFATAINTTSTSDSFVVTGANLTGNVTVTAPASFEVASSLTGSYGTTVTLSPVSGTLAATTVYVRFHPTSMGSINANVTISSTGATTQNVNVTGTVLGPVITTSLSSISNTFTTLVNTPSYTDSFTVSGTDLVSDIMVSAPAMFEVSNALSGSYGSSVNYTPTSGLVNATVYVRFNPTASGSYNDTVMLSSSSAITQYVLVSGNTINSTNPVAFDLSSGNYTLTQWDSLSAAGTYPSNMIFHANNISTPDLTYAPLVNNWTCAYNLTSRPRVKGLSADGFSFINTSSPQYDDCMSGATTKNTYMGAALLAVNTTGASNITLQYNTGLVKQGDGTTPRVYNMRLQYRLDSVSNFMDMSPVAEYTSSGKTDGDVQTSTIALPVQFENVPYVEFRWLYYADVAAGGSGSRPEIRLDEISVSTTVNGINTLVSNNGLYAYPNPVRVGESVYFNQPVSATVYDVYGRVIATVKNASSVNTNQMAAGVYNIVTTDKKTIRIVVQ